MAPTTPSLTPGEFLAEIAALACPHGVLELWPRDWLLLEPESSRPSGGCGIHREPGPGRPSWKLCSEPPHSPFSFNHYAHSNQDWLMKPPYHPLATRGFSRLHRENPRYQLRGSPPMQCAAQIGILRFVPPLIGVMSKWLTVSASASCFYDARHWIYGGVDSWLSHVMDCKMGHLAGGAARRCGKILRCIVK